MAENQDKDEYQFPDVNDVGSDFTSVEPENTEGTGKPERPVLHEQPDIKRVVVAVIAVVLIAVFAYKLGHWLFFSQKEATVSSSLVKTPELPPAPPSQTIPVVAASALPSSVPVPIETVQPTSDMQQKISQVEYTQESLRTEVSNVSQKMSTVDTNLEALKNDMTMMKQALLDMKQKMAEDAEHMKHMLTAQKALKARMVRLPIRTMQYYIQAVIPGRAWLIGENGATVTVNVGSRLPGYGVIRVIDPNLGRVGTSSGKMIVYSQRDS